MTKIQTVIYLVAKLIKRSIIAALNDCDIDSTARVMSGSQFYKTTMGRFSYCGYDGYVSNCRIGAFCSISNNVSIGGAAHPYQFVSTSPVFLRGSNCLKVNFSEHDYEKGSKVYIGNDVWIGFGAIVKAGVTVADGAIIGAGSVVTKDVPPYSIWGGNPAREIKKRFDEETIRVLQASQWWDWDLDKIKKEAQHFSEVHEFIRGLGDQ